MTKSPSPLQIAGILVKAGTSDLDEVVAGLSKMPGVDVHQQEPATGRVVVTLETATVDDQQAGLERIRRHFGVMGAELSYHYAGPPDGAPDDPDQHSSGGCR